MSKAVLISIQPKWCELILSGKKTIEVRKTRPKLETPFKCYIYCTQTTHWNPALVRRYESPNGNIYIGGKHYSEFMTARVIGEFICDSILPMYFYSSDPDAMVTQFEVPGTCLSDVEIMDYLGNGGNGYGWHISELKAYDQPKKLLEFQLVCNHHEDCFTCSRWHKANYACISGITRPPQSWCYVEELED